MEELILTMIVALEEHDGLGFTIDDVNNLIKEHIDFSKKLHCNERGLIVFWRNKYLTNEQFADAMDVEYEDGDFWLIENSFESFLPDKYETAANILDGETDWEPYFYDTSAHDIATYHWGDYNEKTLKAIIKFCDEKGIEVDDELITTENTILKDGDIYFNDKKLNELIDEYDDDFSELINSLSNAISEAQDSAEKSEYYNATKKAFVNAIGPFKRKTITYNQDQDFNGKVKHVEKIWIKLTCDFDAIESFLKDSYGDLDFNEEAYGDLYQILKEMDYFDEFREPNYDYLSGNIDKEVLNDCTQQRLSWD